MPDLPADQRALLAAVIAAPDDDTPRLVYADWLEDAGDDIQANYIRESVRLATLPLDDPMRPGLQERLTAVIREHSDGWAEELRLPAGITRRYRRGFVHTVVFGRLADFLDSAPAWREWAPIEGLVLECGTGPAGDASDEWWEQNEGDFTRFTESADLGWVRSLTVRGLAAAVEEWYEVMRNPTLAGPRELNVPGCGWTDDELDLLAGVPHVAALEVLDLGDVHGDAVSAGLWELESIRKAICTRSPGSG